MMTPVQAAAYQAALSFAGPGPFEYAGRQDRNAARPVVKVYVKLPGQSRGRHVASVLMDAVHPVAVGF